MSADFGERQRIPGGASRRSSFRTIASRVSLGTTYTAHISPNRMFTTVKEVAIKLAVDDSVHLGKAAVKHYALVAFELDTTPGLGQVDAGRWNVHGGVEFQSLGDTTKALNGGDGSKVIGSLGFGLRTGR